MTSQHVEVVVAMQHRYAGPIATAAIRQSISRRTVSPSRRHRRYVAASS